MLTLSTVDYLAEVSRLRAAVHRIEEAMPRASTPEALAELSQRRSATITEIQNLHETQGVLL